MGELLLQALGTVIIGMGVVFSALILISLIIYCFKIFPYIEEKMAARKISKNQTEMPIETQESIVVPTAANGITFEEIAAIAAAIEAYTGLSQSDFIVRRIVRR